MQTVAEVLTPATLREVLLPFVLRFATDPVPNIRFNLAKALERLAASMDEPTKRGAVKAVLDTLTTDAEADVRYYAMRALAAL